MIRKELSKKITQHCLHRYIQKNPTQKMNWAS